MYQNKIVEPTPLTQLDISKLKFKVMVLSPQGGGKTIFSLGSQVMRTLHIDVDGYGIVAAKCFPGNPSMGIPPCNQNNILHFHARNWQEMVNAIDWTEKNYQKIDLVVVDTATEFQRRVITELQGDIMVSTLDQRAWGNVWSIMEAVTQRLVNLPVHVIYNVHEKKGEDPLDFKSKFVPTFQGAFKDVYGKHFSEIWRYTVLHQYYKDANGIQQVQTQRMIQCQLDDIFSGKDRSSSLDKWEHPFIDHLFGKMMHRIQSMG